MQAVDDYIPNPTRALDKPFSLPIEDVFSIQVQQPIALGKMPQHSASGDWHSELILALSSFVRGCSIDVFALEFAVAGCASPLLIQVPLPLGPWHCCDRSYRAGDRQDW